MNLLFFKLTSKRRSFLFGANLTLSLKGLVKVPPNWVNRRSCKHKIIGFGEIRGSRKIQTHIPIDFWPHRVPHLIKNLTFDAVLVKLSCWTHAGFQMKSWSIQHQFFYHLHLDKISFIICAKILKDSKKYTMNDWVRDELGVPGI